MRAPAMNRPQLDRVDQLISQFDQALRTVFGRPATTERGNPAVNVAEAALSEEERRLAAALMRVNHAGEVAAQALYQGQAITARDEKVRAKLERAALEENDHLQWCDERVKELGGHTSYLNPLWYAGSLAIGVAAGIAGDKWSLGFLVETEKQVEAHLDGHLQQLPAQDARSRAVVAQMRTDEIQHAQTALQAGAAPLPEPLKQLMRVTSKAMTATARRI